MGMPSYLAAAVRAGVPPFVLAAADGGDTYWHRRANGDDPEAMMLEELLPRLAAAGAVTSRVGVLGWSMGGYGALLLARRHPGLVAVAVASSPAVWRSFGDSATGAFDSAGDFTTHRVLDVGPAPGVSYRIDCGRADPFHDVSRLLAGQLHAAEHSSGSGCHTAGYWRRVLPPQLAMVGRALAG
jgi:enterochelin esterase-like enzyme